MKSVDLAQVNALIVRAATSGALAGLADATDSSLAVGLAAGTGLALDQLLNNAQQKRIGRAGYAIELASAFRSVDPGEFAAHVASDDRILELSCILLDAASRAADQEHFLFLARLLADGAFAEDAAAVDSFAYVVQAVSDLSPVHLRVLRFLDAEHPAKFEGLARSSDVTAPIHSSALKEPVLSDLIGRGLIKGYTPNELSAQVKAELTISYDDRGAAGFSAYRLTLFGRDVCRRLREAGEQLKKSTESNDVL